MSLSRRRRRRTGGDGRSLLDHLVAAAAAGGLFGHVLVAGTGGHREGTAALLGPEGLAGAHEVLLVHGRLAFWITCPPRVQPAATSSPARRWAASWAGMPVSMKVFMRARSPSSSCFGSVPKRAATPWPSAPAGGL